MQKYIKTYTEFFGIGEQDIVLCEVCNRTANDVHHITSRGLKSFEYMGVVYDDINDILNLIGVCRECHNRAHGGTFTKNYLYKIHNNHILKHKK